MTLRERIEGILIDAQLEPEMIGTLTAQLLAIGRATDGPIIHRLGPNGFHQLEIDGKRSTWHAPTDLIRLGDYIASTDAYIDLVPQIGKIYQIKDKDIRTESVQALTKD